MLFVEADEIASGIWQGSFPGSGRSVAASGFSMLVLCAHEHQEPAELWPGVEVVYAPNYDDREHHLTRELLDVAIKAAHRVEEAVKRGRKALVTCRAGMNRSGLVSALALHFIYGWDGQTCIRRVRRMRKCNGPIKPLSNPDFVQALRRVHATSDIPSGWQEGPGGILVPV